MCGQGCGPGAHPATGGSHGHCPTLGLMADIPGTFPSPGAATGPHRVGVGVVGFRLDKPVSLPGWAA